MAGRRQFMIRPPLRSTLIIVNYTENATSDHRPLPTKPHDGLILDWLSEKVGFRLSAHTFRHTFTTMMLRRCCDLETQRQMGGWCLAGNIYPVLFCSYWVCGCSLPSPPPREQPLLDLGLGHPARPGANIGGCRLAIVAAYVGRPVRRLRRSSQHPAQEGGPAGTNTIRRGWRTSLRKEGSHL